MDNFVTSAAASLVIVGWIAITNLIGLALVLLFRPKGRNRFGPRGVPRTFMGAIHACTVPYVNASGRASRSEFWWFFLVAVLIDLGLDGLDTVLHTSIFHYGSFAFVLPLICAQVRRLHDLNRTGWWVLLNITLIPVVLWVLYAWPSAKNEPDHVANVF